MSHVAFQERGAQFEHVSDYVVIGSGAGGAAAASHLARAGASVTVVEAGAWRDPSDYPSSTVGAMRDLFDDWCATIVRGRALWPVVQASVVGGTTVINSAICVRTPEDIFVEWQKDYGVDGDAMSKAVWEHQDVLEDELCAELATEGSNFGRSNTLATAAAERAGFGGHPTMRYAKGCEGTGQCLQGCRSLRKQSTNLNMIPEVMILGGTVLSCAPVQRIQIEGDRAVGVQGRFRHPITGKRGADFVVRARKAVVVAASATHSPALLQRSGVRVPMLGQHFRAHPGSGVFGLYDEPVDHNNGVTQGWASTAFREDPGFKLETLAIPLEMVASRFSGGGRKLMDRIGKYRHVAMWCHACRAESKGTVKNGFGGKPVVKYTLGEPDMRRFRQGIYTLAQMHFAGGASEVIPGVYGLPYALKADDLELLANGPLDPRAYVAILSHIFGGCVMGTDASNSVCDPTGVVHGYKGLVVADASTIPNTIGVNPQHTIMALSRLYMDALLAREGVGTASAA